MYYYNNVKDVIHIILSGFHVKLINLYQSKFLLIIGCKKKCQNNALFIIFGAFILLLLLFAMIRSVVKSFKVPDVEVAAARMSNESALTHDLLDTKKTLVRLDAGPGWMS